MNYENIPVDCSITSSNLIFLNAMSSDSDLLYRKKKKAPFIPLSINDTFSVSSYLNTSSKLKLKFKKYFGFDFPKPIADYLPIVVLLLILNYLVNGSIIPKPIPFISSSLGRASAPNSISKFTDSKFLGSYNLHGLTSKSTSFISVLDNYIFPRVQDINILKELGYNELFAVEYYGNGKNPKPYYEYSPDFYEDIDIELEDDEEEEEDVVDLKDAVGAEGNFKNGLNDKNKNKNKNVDEKSKKTSKKNLSPAQQLAIKAFKENGRKIYKGNVNPEIILVTSLNYENLNPSYLVKTIQNRIDYAHNNNYGVYARWNQEFIPMFQQTRNNLDSWSRVLAVREAMVAFPKAKWFWYIDETSFIMNNEININNYILKKEALEPIILKNQPILLPDGVVKTYNNFDIDKICLIITQHENGINLDNFLVKNDLHGKALLNLISDPLMRTYPKFKKDVSLSLAHILQWHPTLLSKTVIIPPRTISARSPMTNELDNKNEPKKDGSSDILYQNDDFVVSFSGCKLVGNCEKQLTPFWEKTQQNNDKS